MEKFGRQIEKLAEKLLQETRPFLELFIPIWKVNFHNFFCPLFFSATTVLVEESLVRDYSPSKALFQKRSSKVIESSRGA